MKKSLLLSNGEKVSLEGLCQDSSHGVLLYFYPKDMTSVCTTQALQFRDTLPWFKKRGVNIVGVSRDSLVRHNKFIEKHELTFPLIADVEETLCQHFDVIKEKSMYGRKYLGIVRSTFLLDCNAQVVESWRGVSIKNHLKDVQSYIEAWVSGSK